MRKKGKIKRRRAGHNHILEKKPPKRKRRLRGDDFVSNPDEGRMKRLLGRY